MATRSFDQRTIVPGIYEDAWFHDGDKGAGIGSNPKLRVSSEASSTSAALDGRVFTISGTTNLAGGQSAAINFEVLESFILVRVSAIAGSADVEVSVHDANATGTAGDILEPINQNLCSNGITEVFAQLFTSATAQGNLLAFDKSTLGKSALACEGKPFSVVMERRDQGTSQQVKFACSFELLTENEFKSDEPYIGLRSFTQLESNTEMSQYG